MQLVKKVFNSYKLDYLLIFWYLLYQLPTTSVGQKKKIWLPQEESNLRPSDSVLWCYVITDRYVRCDVMLVG